MKLCLQAEAAECGLACLVMVASYHRRRLELSDLRQRFSSGLKGVDLERLSEFAIELGFQSRALRLDLEEIPQLAVPCILHWNMDHFVVLKAVNRTSIVVLDPALGQRRVPMDEVSRHFTGIALELAPTANFRDQNARPSVSLRELTGKMRGLRGSMAQIFLVALALQGFALAAPLLNQIIVDDILSSGDSQQLLVVCVGFGLLMLIQSVIAAFRTWMITILGQTLSLQWAGNVFSHLLRLPITYFERRHLGDITSRFSSIHAIQDTLTTATIEALLDGIMAILALVMMFLYSKTLGTVVLGAVIIYLGLRIVSYRTGKDISTDRIVIAAKEQTYFLETLRAIQPLKLFNRQDERRSRWQNIMVDLQNIEVSISKLNILTASAQSIIFGLENILVLYLGAQTIMEPGQSSRSEVFTVGMLMAFISYKSQFTGRISSLINFAISFRLLSIHRDRLADIVLSAPEKTTTRRDDIFELPPSIEFRNVSFRHSPHDAWVLRGVNLKITANESVAITGASGSGKTTLAKLIVGIYEPTDGEILYGGIPLKLLGIANLRRCVATVMQNDCLMSGTIGENITCFDQNFDPEKVERAAISASIHREIQQLPMGYRTLIGDLGTGLSGGQQQRLLLARAIYRNPRLMVLDEATSHLDGNNEAHIIRQLKALECTRIVIAHRKETIAGTDREIRLSGGRAIEVAKPSIAVGAPA